jgi:hypothetical protein
MMAFGALGSSAGRQAEWERQMRSMRPIAARRVLAASAVALTLAIGVGANVPAANAGVPGCSWQPLQLLNGWQSEQGGFGTGDPSYCVTSDGMVYLSGSLAAPNGASTDEFAVLPSGDAPAHLDYLNVYTMNGTLGILRVNPDGSLHAYGGQATQFTSLAGISFASAVTEQGMMPLLNGWQSAQSAYSTGDPAFYVSGGIVHLDGSVLRQGGSPPAGSNEWNFAYLPSAAMPTDACFADNVYTYAGGTWPLQINPDGSIWGANGQYTSLAGVSYPASAIWQPLNLLNGTNVTGLCKPASSYIAGGVVYLTGYLNFPAGFNGEFAVLPAGARPAHTLYMVIDGDGPNNAVFVTLRIDTDGAMWIFGSRTTADNFVSLSGLSYHTLS